MKEEDRLRRGRAHGRLRGPMSSSRMDHEHQSGSISLNYVAFHDDSLEHQGLPVGPVGRSSILAALAPLFLASNARLRGLDAGRRNTWIGRVSLARNQVRGNEMKLLTWFSSCIRWHRGP